MQVNGIDSIDFFSTNKKYGSKIAEPELAHAAISTLQGDNTSQKSMRQCCFLYGKVHFKAGPKLPLCAFVAAASNQAERERERESNYNV